MGIRPMAVPQEWRSLARCQAWEEERSRGVYAGQRHTRLITNADWGHYNAAKLVRTLAPGEGDRKMAITADALITLLVSESSVAAGVMGNYVWRRLLCN